MLNLIKDLLLQYIDRIDKGACSLSKDDQWKLINILRAVNEPNLKLTKGQAADFLGISISSFEKLVHLELLPEGKYLDSNQKTKYWEVLDLQNYILEKNK